MYLSSEKEINLTAKEFDLLELLVRNPNKVYSREALLELCRGETEPWTAGDVRTVDVHVRRLREKIEPSPSDPRYVHTKWGVGYYFGVSNRGSSPNPCLLRENGKQNRKRCPDSMGSPG